jgi:hypothetical protein
MPNEDRLHESGYYPLDGQKKGATKRIEFDQAFTSYYSKSTPSEYRATKFQPETAATIEYSAAWETCPLLEKVEFVYTFLRDLFQKIEQNQISINKKIIDEIWDIRPTFDTNVVRYNEAKNFVENRGLQKDKDELKEVEILIRKNILVFEDRLNKVQISIADQYNKLGKTREISGITSRSGSSFGTTNERLEIPAHRLKETEGRLENIKKSMDDLMRTVANAESEEDRKAALKLLEVFSRERIKEEQELKEMQRKERVSA